MKTVKTILKSISLIALLMVAFSCNNDDDDNDAPNADTCNYQGLTALLSGNGTQTLIPEAELKTDYFPNNDGPGLAAVEVYYTPDPGSTFVVTRALTVGAIDNSPEIRINNVDYSGTVTCQRAGNAEGEELRFDIVLSGGEEAELCVVIDEVSP